MDSYPPPPLPPQPIQELQHPQIPHLPPKPVPTSFETALTQGVANFGKTLR